MEEVSRHMLYITEQLISSPLGPLSLKGRNPHGGSEKGSCLTMQLSIKEETLGRVDLTQGLGFNWTGYSVFILLYNLTSNSHVTWFLRHDFLIWVPHGACYYIILLDIFIEYHWYLCFTKTCWIQSYKFVTSKWNFHVFGSFTYLKYLW